MPDRAINDQDLGLSPEVMCQLLRRRSRAAAMAAASESSSAQSRQGAPERQSVR